MEIHPQRPRSGLSERRKLPSSPIVIFSNPNFPLCAPDLKIVSTESTASKTMIDLYEDTRKNCETGIGKNNSPLIKKRALEKLRDKIMKMEQYQQENVIMESDSEMTLKGKSTKAENGTTRTLNPKRLNSPASRPIRPAKDFTSLLEEACATGEAYATSPSKFPPSKSVFSSKLSPSLQLSTRSNELRLRSNTEQLQGTLSVGESDKCLTLQSSLSHSPAVCSSPGALRPATETSSPARNLLSPLADKHTESKHAMIRRSQMEEVAALLNQAVDNEIPSIQSLAQKLDQRMQRKTK